MNLTRFSLWMILLVAPLVAQPPAQGPAGGRGPGGGRGMGPAKNLKVLPADTPIGPLMFNFRGALGVQQCTFCHAEPAAGQPPDFASDANPKKEVARQMIKMVQAINQETFHAAYPGPDAKVVCWTCHRGMNKPEAAPAMAPPGRGPGGGPQGQPGPKQ